jgi:YfiH family protein
MSIPSPMIIEQQAEASPAGGTTTVADEQQILTQSGFYWRERDGLKVLMCGPLEDAGFINGFSTRLGGVSPFPSGDLNLAGFDDDSTDNIAENRRRFLNLFDGSFELTTVWQVHGDVVKTVLTVEEVADSQTRADAIVSALHGILAGVKTADCVPVLIGDPVTGAFAAVHAGWRGTVRSIVGRAVSALSPNFGTAPHDLIAAIGPAACGRNYEVGSDVIRAFSEEFGESGAYFRPTREGHACVDLHLANRDQLVNAGVRHENIFTAPFCNMERTDLFFSYRVDKPKYGRTGRLLSVIGRRAP